MFSGYSDNQTNLPVTVMAYGYHDLQVYYYKPFSYLAIAKPCVSQAPNL